MSGDRYDIPGWTGADAKVRSDGLRIVTNIDQQGFHVPESSLGRAINDCPCCNRPLRSIRAAQLVAEAVYPFRLGDQQ